MNKKRIEKMLPEALEILKDPKCGICKDGKINKSYRSAIASFGAAVTMGGFRAAVAFFSKDAEKGDSDISRSELIRAIDYLCQTCNIEWRDPNWRPAENVYSKVMERDDEAIRRLEQDFLHAAVALKLAMNAFDLISEKKGKDVSNEESTNEESESSVQ